MLSNTCILSSCTALLPVSYTVALYKHSHKDKFITPSLEDTNLVGDVHSFGVSSETHESLLGAEGGDDGVHLLGLHAVELIHGVADLLLVGTEVDEEGKDVLLLQH